MTNIELSDWTCERHLKFFFYNRLVDGSEMPFRSETPESVKP